MIRSLLSSLLSRFGKRRTLHVGQLTDQPPGQAPQKQNDKPDGVPEKPRFIINAVGILGIVVTIICVVLFRHHGEGSSSFLKTSATVMAIALLLVLISGGLAVAKVYRGEKQTGAVSGYGKKSEPKESKDSEEYAGSGGEKKPRSKKRPFLWLLLFVVGVAIGLGIISAIKPPPPPPAGYQRKIAGTAEVERSINGPLDETVITLQDRGYHGPIIIDPRVNTYRVTRSRSDGDWVSIWCANRSAPNEIHVGNNNFNSDEFRYCFNPAGTTTEFYAQGRGIMTVTVTNYR